MDRVAFRFVLLEDAGSEPFSGAMIRALGRDCDMYRVDTNRKKNGGPQRNMRENGMW